MEKQGQSRSRSSGAGGVAVSQLTKDFLKAPSQYLPAVPLDDRTLDAVAVSDPMRGVIRTLVAQLFDEIVGPTLAAQTRDELFRVLGRRLPKYHTTMSALYVLFMTTPAGVALSARAERSDVSLATEAAKIAGEQASEEIRFGEETYASAVRMTARFSALAPARDTDEDQRLCARFNYGSTLHTLGGCMIAAIASERNRATPVGIDVAFELFRGGALDAYIAARGALALREPAIEPASDDPLPLDDEDIALLAG